MPHWPEPWGISAKPMHQLIIDEELKKARISRPANPIGIGWAGPTILAAGTDEQKNRFLPRLLNGEDFWCQLFPVTEAITGVDLVREQLKISSGQAISFTQESLSSKGHAVEARLLTEPIEMIPLKTLITSKFSGTSGR